MMMNPVHGAVVNPHLWECEGIVGLENADKVGCTSLTTLQRMCKPLVTLTQRRKFAVLCALEVYELWSKYDTDKAWCNWAQDWLNGIRAAGAARAAWAAGDAARDAAWAAGAAAAAGAAGDAGAARAAAAAGDAAAAAAAAGDAAWAAWAAAGDAAWAAWAAGDARAAGETIDLVVLAHKAMEKEVEL